MKFDKEAVEYYGQLFMAAMLDVLTENKMPQLVLQASGIADRPSQFLRFVMLDNTPQTLTPEQIKEKIAKLKNTPGSDVGFSYVAEGVRVIIVPESMTTGLHPLVPVGTPQG